MRLGSTIILDLDGTLTVDDKSRGYAEKPANARIVAATRAARRLGYATAINTARSMRTYAGDVEAIRRNTLPVIEDWLRRKRIPVDAVHIGKPWCGPRGWYVDDRNLHLEEFVFRMTGPWSGKTILHVTAHAPRSADDHARLLRLERLFDVEARLCLDALPPDLPEATAIRDDARARFDARRADIEASEAAWVLWSPADGADPYRFFSLHAETLPSGKATPVCGKPAGGRGASLLLLPKAALLDAWAPSERAPGPAATLALARSLGACLLPDLATRRRRNTNPDLPKRRGRKS